MSSTTHTKGPWQWRKNKQGDITHLVSLVKEPNQFAKEGWLNPVLLEIGENWTSHESVDLSIEVDEHVAALIEAAPDYHEAVEQMLAHEKGGGDGWWKGFEMLKAAHAKATHP